MPCDDKNVDIDVDVVEGAIGILMCFLTFEWQIFVNNALRTLFNFPLFFVIFLLRMQLTLKIVSFFLNRNGLF